MKKRLLQWVENPIQAWADVFSNDVWIFKNQIDFQLKKYPSYWSECIIAMIAMINEKVNDLRMHGKVESMDRIWILAEKIQYPQLIYDLLAHFQAKHKLILAKTIVKNWTANIILNALLCDMRFWYVDRIILSWKQNKYEYRQKENLLQIRFILSQWLARKWKLEQIKQALRKEFYFEDSEKWTQAILANRYSELEKDNLKKAEFLLEFNPDSFKEKIIIRSIIRDAMKQKKFWELYEIFQLFNNPPQKQETEEQVCHFIKKEKLYLKKINAIYENNEILLRSFDEVLSEEIDDIRVFHKIKYYWEFVISKIFKIWCFEEKLSFIKKLLRLGNINEMWIM